MKNIFKIDSVSALVFIWLLSGLIGSSALFASESGSLATREQNSEDITFVQTNCPDPFCRDFEIVFELTRPADVVVEICTPMGDTVKKLSLPTLDAGRHSVNWDGRDESGHLVGSGVYIYKVRTERVEKEITLALLN